jgi:multidrug resistance protein, MATE family
MRRSTDNPHRSRAREAALFLALAVPTVLTNLARSALGLTDISILGHFSNGSAHAANASGGPKFTNNNNQSISTSYVAAAGYTITWFTIVGVIFVQGLGAAVNVLGAHAFGSGNVRLLGYYLQVGLTTSTAGAAVVAAVSYFAGQAMHLLVGFDAPMLRLVESFSRVTIVGFFPFVWCSVLNSWLMAQKIVQPQLWTYGACVGINVGLNYLFIYGCGLPGMPLRDGLGFIGSAVATAVSRWIQFFLMVALSARLLRQQRQRRRRRRSEAPFLLDAAPPSSSSASATSSVSAPVSLFHWDLGAAHKAARLSKFFKQAGPMAMTGLLEDGQLQLISVLAGRLGTISAATHQGIFNVFWVLSSLMWAVSAGNRVRVANYLGAGDPEGAQFALRVSAMLGLPTAAIVSLSLFLARDSIGFVFSEDPEVDTLCGEIMTLVGIAYFALGFFYLAMSTLNAAGSPLKVAVSFVCGAWFVCMPLAFVFRELPSREVFLGVPLNGLFGLWTAMSVGYGVTTLIAVLFVCRIDWTRASEVAMENAEAKQQQQQQYDTQC